MKTRYFNEILQGISNLKNSATRALCLLSLAAAAPIAMAQTSPSQALINAGFDNVASFVAEKPAPLGQSPIQAVYASIENNGYRGNHRAIGKALQVLAQAHPADEYHLLVLENGTPRVVVVGKQTAGQWDVTTSYDTAELAKQLKATKSPTATSSYGKIDINLHPILMIDNFKLDKIFDFAIFAAPSIETTLWKGNRTYFQPIFPLVHNLPKGHPDRTPQVGILGLRQDWVNNKHWDLSTSLGTFLYNRYGIHANLTYHINRYLDFGVRAGLTGDQLITGQGWKFGKAKELMAMAHVDYYNPATSLQVKLSGGRFLYGDYGTRLDVIRHFGEITVGAYAMYTDGESNGGFTFAIPISPRSQVRKGAVRLHMGEYFGLEYSAKNYYDWLEQRRGQNYRERPDNPHTSHYWQAAYLEQYVERYLNGYIK
ncbi:MAG: YjbH domain-containing protein [Bacteroidaceae bacterium]|nr:YjbH domain-containing protein [Bacteroidaceae bacterium]